MTETYNKRPVPPNYNPGWLTSEFGAIQRALSGDVGIPVVGDDVERNRSFAPASTATDTLVANSAGQLIERLRRNKTYTSHTEPPHHAVNVRKFTLAGWLDSNGISTVGTGYDYPITQAEIDANTGLWRGTYFAGWDTRDYVCLQEAIYEAFARASSNGDIQWQGSDEQTITAHPFGPLNFAVYVPAGTYSVNRKVWLTGVIGGEFWGDAYNSSCIQTAMDDTTIFFGDGCVGLSFHNLWFFKPEFRPGSGNTVKQKSNFWHPNFNLDWLGTSTSRGIFGTTPHDLTQYTIASVSSPGLKIAALPTDVGAGWKKNYLRGQYLVIYDDPTNPSAIGQAFRIIGNELDGTIYIEGQWIVTPSTACTVIINPTWFGWGRWHTHNTLSDWMPWTSTGALYRFGLYDGGNPTALDGQAIYRFAPGNSAALKAKTLRSTGAGGAFANPTYDVHTVTLSADWDASAVNYPSPQRASGDFGLMSLGDSGKAQSPQVSGRYCNYAIATATSRVYASGITNPTNDCWITVDTPNPSYADHDRIGAFVQFVTGNNLMGATASSVSGAQFTVTGVVRHGEEIGKRISIRGTNQCAIISNVTDNGTDTTYTMDQGLTSLVNGSTVDIVDTAMGMILPIAENNGGNKLWFTWDAFAGRIQNLFSRVPEIGTKVNQLARTNLNSFSNINFSKCAWTTHSGDSVFHWARSGSASQGSESTWTGCVAAAVRVSMYVNSLNAIGLHWYGGSLGTASEFQVFVSKGEMSFHGADMATGEIDQIGYDISLGAQGPAAAVLDDCYTESPNLISTSQTTTLLNCKEVGGPANAVSDPNRNWQVGQVWNPNNFEVWAGGRVPSYASKGRMFRVVEITGTGNPGGACVIPTVFADDPSMTPYLILTDGAGNSVTFMRVDWRGWSFNAQCQVFGGTLSFTRPTSSQGSPVFIIGVNTNREDWAADFSAMTIPVSAFTFQGGVSILGARVIRSDFAQQIPWNPAQNDIPNAQSDYTYNPHILDGPLLWRQQKPGSQMHVHGLWPVYPENTGGLSGKTMIQITDEGNPDSPIVPVVLTKRSRSGANKAGVDFTIAGGPGTGTGAGGAVLIQAAPAGTAGSTLNDFANAGKFDANATAGETRFLLWDVTAGTLKRVSVGASDSGGTGFKVLRVVN